MPGAIQSEWFGMTLADWLVLVVYLVGITMLGTWAVRKVKSSTSYFISDRKFGKLMIMFFNFGTGTHTDQAVSVVAKTYGSGASGIWYQMLWIFSTPFYWLIGPMFRRMRAVTTSDFFEARFDRSTAVLYAVVAILNLVVNIGVMLKGSGAMIDAVTGGKVNADLAIFAMTVMFVIYGVAGGLSAAIITDFVQGLLTIVLSFLILPFALYAVGGMAEMRDTIGDPSKFHLVATTGQIGLFYIAVLSLNGLIGFPTQPHVMGICAAGKAEMESRVGLAWGILIKRFCTIGWALTALCALAYYSPLIPADDHDKVYGLMARDLLPSVSPGLVGLFIASMLAAVMSSCDAFMVSSSALFTENIYRKLWVRNAGDRHYMFVGRLVSVLVVLAGIVFAFSLTSVVEGLEVFWKISAMMGLAFWLGLFWRRTTPAGAWAGTLVGFACLLFTSEIRLGKDDVIWDFNARFAHMLPEVFTFLDTSKDTPKLILSLPWQMLFYLGAGLVAVVVVSLLTRRVSKAKLDHLYATLRTPVGPGEPETEPFELPPGVEPPPRRVLLDRFELEIPRISKIGLLGFLVTWAAVMAIIALMYWIFSLGA